MAITEITLHSASLNLNTTVTVCFPEGIGVQGKRPGSWKPGAKYQVLYLLPGGGGDGSDWARHTCIEWYAQTRNLFVVSPATHLSLYTDMYYGCFDKFFTWVTRELPRIMQWMFPISTRPEDTFLAGFSMGGYGAFKWAMTEPERFAAVGTFGGVHDMVDTVTRNHLHDGVLDRDFFLAFHTVEELVGSPNDAMYLAEKNAKAGRFGPRLFCSVGDDDFTRPFNDRACAKLESWGYKITRDSGPGIHSYLYCDRHLETFLDWAGVKKTPLYREEA